MKSLVIGSTGNVGKYVVAELLKRKHKVTGAVLEFGELKQHYKDVDEVIFDVTDSKTFTGQLAGYDAIFLMRPPQIDIPEQMYGFIDEIKKAKIKICTFLSLIGIEKNKKPPHYKIEKYIEQVEQPHCFVRPSFFMQNVSGVHSVEIRDNDEIFVPAGKSKTNFADAKNIGEVIALTMDKYQEHIGKKYNITGPKPITYYEVAEILSRVLGRKIRYAKPSPRKYQKHMVEDRKLSVDYIKVTRMLYFLTRLGMAKDLFHDYEKLMGKKPNDFETFARREKKV